MLVFQDRSESGEGARRRFVVSASRIPNNLLRASSKRQRWVCLFLSSSCFVACFALGGREGV